jgi:cytidine deaminase
VPETSALDALPQADRDLVVAAQRAREHAHAPYSDFAVGAAIRAVDGTIYLGCNVEISSYGLTECAERVALFSARASGATEFEALAVAGPDSVGQPTPPCGACRQVIWDLAGDIPVLLATATGEVDVWTAAELLPEPFGPAHLGKRK